GYAPQFGEQLDADWTHYLTVLYPGIRELHQIKNRRTIEALANAGDSLSTKRTITHWIYVQRNDELQTISNLLNTMDYVVSIANADATSAYPFVITASRDDFVDQDAVDGAVFQILDAIDAKDAVYDGWESPVR
ncbi:MAG: ribonuclease E inhibitor RraB, partial [Gemmatimonadaceae bacterium]